MFINDKPVKYVKETNVYTLNAFVMKQYISILNNNDFKFNKIMLNRNISCNWNNWLVCIYI